jgi:large subunit ribosomal protein L30
MRFRGVQERSERDDELPGKRGDPQREEQGDPVARLKITQIKSGIGYKQNQRETLRSLGLKRIRDVVVKEDRPEFRGMIQTVTHLVSVEEVE